MPPAGWLGLSPDCIGAKPRSWCARTNRGVLAHTVASWRIRWRRAPPRIRRRFRVQKWELAAFPNPEPRPCDLPGPTSKRRALSGPPFPVACGHKPNSVSRVRATIIHLGPPLPAASSTLPVPVPEGEPADHRRPDFVGTRDCLRLHPVGFTVPRLSPVGRCALTAPFHPCLCQHTRQRQVGPSAVCFLWHFP